jgi:hypothetical protein
LVIFCTCDDIERIDHASYIRCYASVQGICSTLSHCCSCF